MLDLPSLVVALQEELRVIWLGVFSSDLGRLLTSRDPCARCEFADSL
jgi:hypothetical protein